MKVGLKLMLGMLMMFPCVTSAAQDSPPAPPAPSRTAPVQEPSSDEPTSDVPSSETPTPQAEGDDPLTTLPGTGEVAATRLGGDSEPLPFELSRDKARLRRLGVDDQVWLDARQKIVVVGTKVALQRGALEMFACPRGTKEHESVLSVNSQAFIIHAALLAAGAKPGTPVQFQPEYAAASGQEIELYVVWEHEGAPRWQRAQEWVIDHKTKEVMSQPWVFGGSMFVTDERSGERHYMAEAGELICLSNFTTATMDLPVESSQSNQALMFEANADSVPKAGTLVTLVMVPKQPKAPAENVSN